MAKAICVRIPDGLREIINENAAALGVSASAYVRAIIIKSLDVEVVYDEDDDKEGPEEKEILHRQEALR